MKNKGIKMEVFPKTIYTDLVSLTDPTILGITIRYYNYSDSNLYLKLFGEGSSHWNTNSVEIGLVNSGVNGYFSVDEFLERTKPTAELEDAMHVTLRGYSDAGYTNLIYEFSRDVTVIFVKSDDGTWTTDELDTFDDGTDEGWNVVNELNNWIPVYPAESVDIEYVLSSPYAYRMHQLNRTGGPWHCEVRGRMEKSITTPDRDEVYAIFNIISKKSTANGWRALKYISIQRDATEIIYIGRPHDNSATDYFPEYRWMRIMVPLPKNSTFTFKIVVDYHTYNTGATPNAAVWTWLDDFKVMSR